MVPRVCTLKKNASTNEPGLALAMPPVSRKTIANSTLSASHIATIANSVTGQGAPRSSWWRSIQKSLGALTTSVPESLCAGLAMRPSIARPGGMARKNRLLGVGRVLHVLLHCVLLVPRVLLRVADAPLRLTLGLRGAAVRAQLVLYAVLSVGGRVLHVLDGVALRQSWQRQSERERCDDTLDHLLSPSQAGSLPGRRPQGKLRTDRRLHTDPEPLPRACLPVLRRVARRRGGDRLLRVGRLPGHVARTRGHPRVLRGLLVHTGVRSRRTRHAPGAARVRPGGGRVVRRRRRSRAGPGLVRRGR